MSRLSSFPEVLLTLQFRCWSSGHSSGGAGASDLSTLHLLQSLVPPATAWAAGGLLTSHLVLLLALSHAQFCCLQLKSVFT